MEKGSGSRVCLKCKVRFDLAESREVSGEPNPRGRFCPTCGDRRASELLEELRRIEANILRNLWQAYRGWWKHYTPPGGWRARLRKEGSDCPYCGVALEFDRVVRPQRAVLDHMDPLEKGGEDSLRNVVYCCAACHGRKRDKLFTRWLLDLDEPHRSLSRTIYVHKHEHPGTPDPGFWLLLLPSAIGGSTGLCA